jgi:2-methylcitrate dehydratase PrpD
MDGAWNDPPPARFLFTAIKYKLHACCHGTHAMIEALAALTHAKAVKAEEVVQLHLSTSPRWLKVCDIKEPRSGLEVKFSYAWLAGMVFAGIQTASDRAYTDALARDPALADFARRVTVTGDVSVGDMQARGSVLLADGRTLPFAHDLDAPIPAATLESSLRTKAQGLLGARADALWSAVAGIDGLSARDLGALLRGQG